MMRKDRRKFVVFTGIFSWGSAITLQPTVSVYGRGAVPYGLHTSLQAEFVHAPKALSLGPTPRERGDVSIMILPKKMTLLVLTA